MVERVWCYQLRNNGNNVVGLIERFIVLQEIRRMIEWIGGLLNLPHLSISLMDGFVTKQSFPTLNLYLSRQNQTA